MRQSIKIDISTAGDLNASHVESTSGSIKIQADGNNVGGGEIRADGQLTITDQIVQNKDFELIADRMVIHNDIKNQSGGQIILTAKQIEHQSGTIQTESRLQFNTEEITQTGGQILTDRLEIVSNGNAVFESSTNEINQLHATIDNGDFVFSHASDLQIDQVSANTVHLTSINGSVQADGNIDTIDIHAENVILSAAQDIKDITFADQTSLTLSIIPYHMYNDPIRVKFNDNQYISSIENHVFNTYIFYDGVLIEVGQLQKQDRHVCLFPYSSTIFSPNKYASGYIIPNKINTLWKLQPLQIKENVVPIIHQLLPDISKDIMKKIGKDIVVSIFTKDMSQIEVVQTICIQFITHPDIKKGIRKAMMDYLQKENSQQLMKKLAITIYKITKFIPIIQGIKRIVF